MSQPRLPSHLLWIHISWVLDPLMHPPASLSTWTFAASCKKKKFVLRFFWAALNLPQYQLQPLLNISFPLTGSGPMTIGSNSWGKDSDCQSPPLGSGAHHWPSWLQQRETESHELGWLKKKRAGDGGDDWLFTSWFIINNLPFITHPQWYILNP